MQAIWSMSHEAEGDKDIRRKGARRLQERGQSVDHPRKLLHFCFLFGTQLSQSSVFSYYAAFVAVTSYVLTYETPTNALARLQLREMLAVTNDPAIDRLAPATFKPTLPLVLATALFSVSLALKLATFFIGIFCKLWLHEYEKCGSLEAKKSCLLRGLGFPGLRAWPVDRIILEFLPKLFTVAMVLNIIGLLFLFWPLHPVMGVIVAAMVGFIVTSIAGLWAVLTLNPPFKSRSKRG